MSEIKTLVEITNTLPNLESFEGRLTPQNREQVRKYITNCNEELYAVLLLGAFDDSIGQPLSNAFYLHELEELEEFRRKGHEFVKVDPTNEFRKKREEIYDTDREPHLIATLIHCRYLQLQAKKTGCDISLGTCLEYDPISSPEDKQALRQQDTTLTVDDNQRKKAKQFFTDLARNEKRIFDQPFSMGNTSVYQKEMFEK